MHLSWTRATWCTCFWMLTCKNGWAIVRRSRTHKLCSSQSVYNTDLHYHKKTRMSRSAAQCINKGNAYTYANAIALKYRYVSRASVSIWFTPKRLVCRVREAVMGRRKTNKVFPEVGALPRALLDFCGSKFSTDKPLESNARVWTLK